MQCVFNLIIIIHLYDSLKHWFNYAALFHRTYVQKSVLSRKVFWRRQDKNNYLITPKCGTVILSFLYRPIKKLDRSKNTVTPNDCFMWTNLYIDKHAYLRYQCRYEGKKLVIISSIRNAICFVWFHLNPFYPLPVNQSYWIHKLTQTTQLSIFW